MCAMTELERLMRAVDEHDASGVCRMLEAAPGLVHLTDRCGFTPLMRAALSGAPSLSVIAVLLAADADVNLQTAEGYTALHCAIDVEGRSSLDATEIIWLLVAAGSSLTLRQNYGWTPLLCAVIRGRVDETRALLGAGADPNELVPSDSVPAFNAGRTALMAALTSPRSEELVAALLEAGADPFRVDQHGMNFFQYAESLKIAPGEWRFSDAIERGEAILREWLEESDRDRRHDPACDIRH